MKKLTLLLLAAVGVASCHKDLKSVAKTAVYPTRSDVAVTSSYIVLSNYAYTWDSSGAPKKLVKMIPVNLNLLKGKDKMSIVVVDKNGKVFDPANGEVVSRDEGLKIPDEKLEVKDIGDGKFNYDLSGKTSYYSKLEDYTGYEITSKNRLYYKIPGSLTLEGKDVYLGFSVYFSKRGAYQIVLVAPVAHV